MYKGLLNKLVIEYQSSRPLLSSEDKRVLLLIDYINSLDDQFLSHQHHLSFTDFLQYVRQNKAEALAWFDDEYMQRDNDCAALFRAFATNTHPTFDTYYKRVNAGYVIRDTDLDILGGRHRLEFFNDVNEIHITDLIMQFATLGRLSQTLFYLLLYGDNFQLDLNRVLHGLLKDPTQERILPLLTFLTQYLLNDNVSYVDRIIKAYESNKGKNVFFVLHHLRKFGSLDSAKTAYLLGTNTCNLNALTNLIDIFVRAQILTKERLETLIEYSRASLYDIYKDDSYVVVFKLHDCREMDRLITVAPNFKTHFQQLFVLDSPLISNSVFKPAAAYAITETDVTALRPPANKKS